MALCPSTSEDTKCPYRRKQKLTSMRLILVALLLELVGAACSSGLSESDKSEIIQLIQEHSIPGPQGSVGPQGIRGKQGPPGARDTEDPQGERGEQGPPGSRGTEGPQGIRGEPGPPGTRGTEGPPGPRGAQGPQGIQGEQGDVAEYDTPATTTISPTPSEVISGRGYSVINCQLRPGRTVIQLTHQGDSNFIIQLHDDEGDREYLVNEIGFYSGSKLITVDDDSYSSLSPGQMFHGDPSGRRLVFGTRSRRISLLHSVRRNNLKIRMQCPL